MWQVYAYKHVVSKTYSGKGSSERTHYRTFAEQPDANRYAKNCVEAGPYLYATVENVKE